MTKKVIFIFTLIFLTAGQAFAHDHRNNNSPMVILSLLTFLVGGVGILWSVMIRGKGFRPNQVIIFLLMASTAMIHIFIGTDNDWLLLLNGIGYLGFLFALFLPNKQLDPLRSYILLVAVAYTTVTFFGYFRLHGVGIWILYDWVGVLDKLIEFVLIIVSLHTLRQGNKVLVSAESLSS